jgi:hypothetical protein
LPAVIKHAHPLVSVFLLIARVVGHTQVSVVLALRQGADEAYVGPVGLLAAGALNTAIGFVARLADLGAAPLDDWITPRVVSTLLGPCGVASRVEVSPTCVVNALSVVVTLLAV